MKIECTNKHCSHVVEPKKSCFFEESTNKRGRKKLSHYEINLKMVLLSLAVGIGPSETGQFLGFLDLPQASSFEHYSFKTIENEIGYALEEIVSEAMNEALNDKI